MALAEAATAILGDAEAPYALISSASRFIGTLIFDVTVREVHTDEFTITVHPVETGTPISDHYFANPKIIEITCASSDSTAGVTGYAQTVYEAMRALADSREPFDVSTGKRSYQNMMFGNFTVVTDAESEFALMVTARLQEVIISQTSGAAAGAQASPADTAPETDVGSQMLQTAIPTFAQSQSGFGAANDIGSSKSVGSSSTLPTFAQTPSP